MSENIKKGLVWLENTDLLNINDGKYLIDGEKFRFDVGSVTIGLYPFVAAVVGGIGSLPGAVLGGLLIGLIRGITGVYSDIGLSVWVDTIIYVIFVIILLFKPAGLLGKDEREKV